MKVTNPIKKLQYMKVIIRFLTHCGVKDISCKFSVTGDTPVLIRSNSTIELIPIKDAIERVKSNSLLEILSLSESHDVVFSPITGHLEHEEAIYELLHDNCALPLKATKHHSVFIWDKGNIIQKKVEELRSGDFLLTFNNSKKIKRKVPDDLYWTYLFRGKKLTSSLSFSHELMRLFGYYLSEGHLTESIHQIGFTFNRKETKYIKDCKELLQKITKRNISIRHPNENSTQILIHSKEWYAFFKKYCKRGAKNKQLPDFVWSLTKKDFLPLLICYIRGDGYKLGEYSISIKSVSQKLIQQLVWVCKLHGISCSINDEIIPERIMPQGTLMKESHVWVINIPKSELDGTEFFRKRNKFSPYPRDKLLPIDGLKKVFYQCKPKKFNNHRKEQMTLSKSAANFQRIDNVISWFKKSKSIEFTTESIEIICNYESIMLGDIGTSKIKSIIKKGKSKVYDVSVKGTERFFGGEYPILLHNSGNKGFHIAVPFEAFPTEINGTDKKLLFPEVARVVAAYIKDHIEDEMAKQILQSVGGDYQKIKERTGVEESKLIYYTKGPMGGRIAKLNVDSFIEIDTILIASRHLYRMPYSLHEKSGLMSLPIPNNQVMNFKKPMADPSKFMAPLATFLDRTCPNGPSATNLVRQAYDYQTKAKEKERFHNLSESLKEKKEKDFQDIEITSALTEEFFPPCIKLLLNGIEDGKKRAIFVLINFLGKLGWTKLAMKKFLMDWNKKNPEPLREGYILGQLAHFNPKDTKMPPNCNNDGYYPALQVCKPDQLCKHINNPVNYSIIMYRKHLEKQEWIKEQQAKEEGKILRKKQKLEREARKAAKIKAKADKEQAQANLEEQDKNPLSKAEKIDLAETIPELPPTKPKAL